MQDRTLIVRPTNLTENKAVGSTTLFDGNKKAPSMEIDRKDLAEWVVHNAIFGNEVAFGSKPINITCKA